MERSKPKTGPLQMIELKSNIGNPIRMELADARGSKNTYGILHHVNDFVGLTYIERGYPKWADFIGRQSAIRHISFGSHSMYGNSANIPEVWLRKDDDELDQITRNSFQEEIAQFVIYLRMGMGEHNVMVKDAEAARKMTDRNFAAELFMAVNTGAQSMKAIRDGFGLPAVIEIASERRPKMRSTIIRGLEAFAFLEHEKYPGPTLKMLDFVGDNMGIRRILIDGKCVYDNRSNVEMVYRRESREGTQRLRQITFGPNAAAILRTTRNENNQVFR